MGRSWPDKGAGRGGGTGGWGKEGVPQGTPGPAGEFLIKVRPFPAVDQLRPHPRS